MRRVSNLNSLRIGIFGTWYSLWYDKEYYSFLVYKDYKLIEYLNSIFYRLRLPTSHFYLNRINQNFYYIQSNIYLTKPSFNKFNKLLHSNKSIFKYISLLEYLFDFSLLIPNSLSRDKNYIEDIFLKNKKLNFSNINNFYHLYYSLFNINDIYKSNSLYFKLVFFYSDYVNNLFLLNNKNKFKYILSKDNYKVYNHELKNDNINSLNSFNNYFNINRNNNEKKFNKIKSFIANFILFFSSDKNLIYFNINLNFIFIIKSLNFFFIRYFSKFYFFFSFISIFINMKNYFFLKSYYKFYFFLKKNKIYNNFFMNYYKNLNLFFSKNKFSTVIKKKSYLSHNLKLFKEKSRNSFKSKYYLNYKLSKFIFSIVNNNYGFVSLFYIKDFNSSVRESLNNSIRINREIIDMVYFKKINRFNSFHKKIINFFKKRLFLNFNYYIGLTIYNYTGKVSFFLPTYYITKFPSFDSKLLVDYIIFNLKRKHRISRVLNRIAGIQRKLNFSSKKMSITLFNEIDNINNNYINKFKSYYNFNNLFNIVFFNKIYNKDLFKKFNPISGIRIEFSGPPKKAQMSKTVAYHNIIHDHKLIGKMPTHTVYADIHYYQSYVKLKRSTFGIKVWLFYYTRILNINYVNKTFL